MSSLNTDSLLLGLGFLEASARKDSEMSKMYLASFNKDEIIKGLVMVSMAMTSLSANNEKYGDVDLFDMIEMARKTVLSKTDI